MGLLEGPTAVIALAAVGLIGLASFSILVRWERQDRPEIALGVLAGALFSQLLFYAVDSHIPVGPFRPGPLRLPELIILAAIAARLVVRKGDGNVTPAGMAWLAFCTWYVTGAVLGLYYDHETSVVLFHGKFAVYAGGSYLLASGVPIGRLLGRRLFGGALLGLGAVVLVQLAYGFVDSAPAFPAGVGADAASFYFGIAVVVLTMECTRRTIRTWTVAAMAPLLMGPLFVGQRASFVHAVVSAAVLALAVAGTTWRRRMLVRPTQVLLGAMAVLALATLLSLPQLAEGNAIPATVTGALDDTFGGVGNQFSAQARVSKWEQGWLLFREKPLMGQGLGIDHEFFQPGVWATGQIRTGNTFDNIFFDLLVRSGVVGLTLFVAAIGFTVRDACLVWFRHPDARVAAFGLAAASFLIGIVAKGAVESILEKVVLACAIGIAAGAVAAATADMSHPRWERTDGVAGLRPRRGAWK
jgi:O-antigen ligase